MELIWSVTEPGEWPGATIGGLPGVVISSLLQASVGVAQLGQVAGPWPGAELRQDVVGERCGFRV
jgi:hypothetical protein